MRLYLVQLLSSLKHSHGRGRENTTPVSNLDLWDTLDKEPSPMEERSSISDSSTFQDFMKNRPLVVSGFCSDLECIHKLPTLEGTRLVLSHTGHC